METAGSPGLRCAQYGGREDVNELPRPQFQESTRRRGHVCAIMFRFTRLASVAARPLIPLPLTA